MKHVKIDSIKTGILVALSLITMDTYTHIEKFYGSVHLADQTYADLEISGTAHLTHVTITHSALVYGSAYLADVACPELTVRGTLHADSIDIKHADIFGSCHCSDAYFDVLMLYGSCVINNTKINNQLCVHGSMVACKIECPLIEVSSTHVEFKKSSIGALVVKKMENNYKGVFNLWGLLGWGTATSLKSELYLDATSVDTITFQDIPGLVILTNGATVAHVINGTIEKRS